MTAINCYRLSSLTMVTCGLCRRAYIEEATKAWWKLSSLLPAYSTQTLYGVACSRALPVMVLLLSRSAP